MEWSNLPPELLVTIAETLTEITDHIRFRSVCVSWRSAFKFLPTSCQLPWLIFPSNYSSPHFYSFSEDRIYKIPIPLTSHSNLHGSASGWIMSVEGSFGNLTIAVFNPFTRVLISLPCPDLRAALSFVVADTLVWDRSDSVVVGASSKRHNVFYCRISDHSWREIESMQDSTASQIIFHDCKFYILKAKTCDVVVLDGETLEEMAVLNPPNLESSKRNTLVSSGELLLLVESYWSYSASNFYKVYQMNFDELEEWRVVDDIGDHAIFLDNIHCFSIQVDGRSRLRRNCIYSYTSRMFGASIFDLGNRECKPLEGAFNRFEPGEGCVPTWIVPSLN